MVYYAEDDAEIRELVIYTLRLSGIESQGFDCARELYTACANRKPDLILLDIMLPDEDGIKILKRLKKDAELRSVPVVMLTARGSEFDKVQGLDLGAEDYISKPFGMMELVARVKARLRAHGGEAPNKLICGMLELDSLRHTVTVAEKPVSLTLKEFSLLELLMRNPGQAFTRDQLLERNWDYSYEGGTRTVDVHVQTLRSKLGQCASMIRTVRGVGYKFEG